MVAYKGTRAGNLRQYVSNKPDKWGFKIFCRSSSTEIIHDMLLYQGSSTFFNVSLSSQEQSLLLGAKVVLTLSRTTDKPHHSVLFFDNFFTNYNLIEFMKAELNIHCVGTVRANRSGGANCFLQEDKILSKEKQGAIDCCSSAGVTAVKWHDNECVTLLSNAYGVEPLSYVQRYHAEEKKRCQLPVQQLHRHTMSTWAGLICLVCWCTSTRPHQCPADASRDSPRVSTCGHCACHTCVVSVGCGGYCYSGF
ncbi:hypothetical protein HPB51_013798 [Rhipicephalus microplus]|uniref:PiggyBac transposable element-derived protein domain-containing protein n=1 Tax=Rhipicephalus microplus TaxID=6941 RepID=A0A9J6F2Y0_RHIMP|nr:hypothetical protein HPB51_013798 [Rhipicephalus microplus]